MNYNRIFNVFQEQKPFLHFFRISKSYFTGLAKVSFTFTQFAAKMRQAVTVAVQTLDSLGGMTLNNIVPICYAITQVRQGK
jgi:hypothetical protein